MDFGVLPPEINSGRMYSGPGPGSMLAAAAAWDGLAAELRSAAASYGSVVSGLTAGSWQGPASASMATAAAPYVAWMSGTAAQAEEAATKAKAAVAAYETAFAATVAPPVIGANRAQLMALIATNFFGQNSPAIAATEAQYGEMWAQDAAAMYHYAGASSAASAVTPFLSPPQTTSPVGLASQAIAVTKAAGTPAGTAAQTAASTTTTQVASASTVPQALQQLASPTSPLNSLLSAFGISPSGALGPPLTGPTGLISTVFGNSSGIWNAVTNYGYFPLGSVNSLLGVAGGLVPGAPAPSPALGGALPPPGAIGAWGSPVPAGPWGGSVSASVGQAGTIGRLSVPSAWAATAPPQISSTASPGWFGTQAHAAGAAGPGGLLRGIPLNGAGGRRAAGGFIHKYGFRHTVMPRPPSAG